MNLKNELYKYIANRNKNIVTFNLFSEQSKKDLVSLVKLANVAELIQLSIENIEIDELLKIFILDDYWEAMWMSKREPRYLPQHTLHCFDQIKSMWLLSESYNHNERSEELLQQAARLGSFAAIHSYTNHQLHKLNTQFNLQDLDLLYAVITSAVNLHLSAGTIHFIDSVLRIIDILNKNTIADKHAEHIKKYYMDAKVAVLLAKGLKNEFTIPMHNAFHPDEDEKFNKLLLWEQNIDSHLSEIELREATQLAGKKKANITNIYMCADDRFHGYELDHRKSLNSTYQVKR